MIMMQPELRLIYTPLILQMANFKVAVFILVLGVLSGTAFSDTYNECLNKCDDQAYDCVINCGRQSCASDCRIAIPVCYGKCKIQAKREYYSSLPSQRDQTEHKGLYDILQK